MVLCSIISLVPDLRNLGLLDSGKTFGIQPRFFSRPYCPIYGSGALLDVFPLGWIHNLFFYFSLCMLVNCTLEYLTGWALEEIFHAKWWD